MGSGGARDVGALGQEKGYGSGSARARAAGMQGQREGQGSGQRKRYCSGMARAVRVLGQLKS